MAYYSPQPSYNGQPMMSPYPSSPYPSNNGYLSPQPVYAGGPGQPYVVSSHSSRNSHGRHHSRSPYHDGGHRSHSHHHGGSHGRRRHLSLGQRILRWFGLGRHRSHTRNHKGFGFFGNDRHRAKYIDQRTGIEVDRQGRPVYRV